MDNSHRSISFEKEVKIPFSCNCFGENHYANDEILSEVTELDYRSLSHNTDLENY